MIGLIQRVLQARVEVDHQSVGSIGQGLLVLLCAERGDGQSEADRFLAKILKLRIFADESGRMNRSLVDIDGQGKHGGLLLVSQFTLAADLSSGNRPSFANAAPPEEGRQLYDYLVSEAARIHSPTATGIFGAHMQVHLINDGPVTIPLHVLPRAC